MTIHDWVSDDGMLSVAADADGVTFMFGDDLEVQCNRTEAISLRAMLTEALGE